MSNPLDPVLKWYQTTMDSIRVTERVIKKSIPKVATNRHVFFSQAESESLADLKEAKEELARVAVLALTAIFERTLRDHLANLPVVAAATGNSLHDRVRENILREMERWAISRDDPPGIIELFSTVDPAVRGQVKQIIAYRNWVAHGHTLNQPRPVNTNPVDCHQRLTEFLSQAGLV